MRKLPYKCTACDEVFIGVDVMSAHIAAVHEPKRHEDKLGRMLRDGLDVPDDDDDDDDDEGEDRAFPWDVREARKRLEHLRARSAVLVTERNYPALEQILCELERFELHLDIVGREFQHMSGEAAKAKAATDWVLRDGCGVAD